MSKTLNCVSIHPEDASFTPFYAGVLEKALNFNE